jgi:hypothetical protein
VFDFFVEVTEGASKRSLSLFAKLKLQLKKERETIAIKENKNRDFFIKYSQSTYYSIGEFCKNPYKILPIRLSQKKKLSIIKEIKLY